MDAITISQLSKEYASGNKALQDINLSIKQGDFFGLLGPNGAGKSTLINILVSLVRKTTGTISILGHNLTTHCNEAKSCLGIVPQEFNFYIFGTPERILINQAGYYGISRSQAKPTVDFLLQKMGLWEMRHEQVHYLSGGMKRRLMIARGLVHSPKILILDEPTAGVDIKLRFELWDYLTALNDSGITIILTTHYLEEAEKLCRTLAILNHGRIVDQGTINYFLGNEDREYFEFELDHELPDHINCKPFVIQKGNFGRLTVCINQDQRIGDFIDLVRSAGCQIISITNKTRKLEQLFLNITKEGANED